MSFRSSCTRQARVPLISVSAAWNPPDLGSPVIRYERHKELHDLRQANLGVDERCCRGTLPAIHGGRIVAWFAQHYPKIKASSVRAHIKGMTANDPSRHHYRVSGMTALFVRQPDKTLIPI